MMPGPVSDSYDPEWSTGENADPRTTRLYDRRKREVTRNIVERISI
jgi:hypothetical protein